MSSLFQQYQLIEQSKLFDAAFYLEQNPDVASAGIDPLLHYIEHGHTEGRPPSPSFDVIYYVEQCEALGETVTNPLVHYVLEGRNRGIRTIRELNGSDGGQEAPSAVSEIDPEFIRNTVREHFDSAFYLELYKDVEQAGVDPLEHYVFTGWREGRNPSSEFDTKFYLEQNEDVRQANINPYFHYLIAGKDEGRAVIPARAAGTAQPAAAEDLSYVRNIVGPHFDAEFYLNQYRDVQEAGIDPLKHFLTAGWREGRDPCWGFDTSYYLDSYQDIRDAGVNPFFHFLVAGRKEGRSPRDELSIEISVLQGSISPREKAISWLKSKLPKPLSAVELQKKLDKLTIFGAEASCLAVSHDNYIGIVGGIQNCLVDEQHAFNALRVNYFQIFPEQPLPKLSDEKDPGRLLVGLTLNGKLVGSARLDTLTKLLPKYFTGEAKARPAKSVKAQLPSNILVLHSLLGHSPEALSELGKALDIQKTYFWIHDYFALCENYTLQRSDLTFCGAPSDNSQACRICAYGVERQTHTRRIERLFKDLSPTVISPSKAALEVWKAAHDQPRAKEQLVLPHCELAPVATGKAKSPSHAASAKRGPLRIGFLGFDKYHKGWASFERLAERFQESQEYSFYHLGKRHGKIPFIEFTPVSVSYENRNSMLDAVRANQLDVIVIWPTWPETFSFVVYEAIASGAMVVTNSTSGNVASAVKSHQAGLILKDEDELVSLLQTGNIRKVCAARKKKLPQQPVHLLYSGCTASLFKQTAAAGK